LDRLWQLHFPTSRERGPSGRVRAATIPAATWGDEFEDARPFKGINSVLAQLADGIEIGGRG
jgi:hypothetical protein